jgi:hypothetical protein
MTVAEMRSRMDRSEFLLWSRFYVMLDQAAEVANARG